MTVVPESVSTTKHQITGCALDCTCNQPPTFPQKPQKNLNSTIGLMAS